MKTDLVMWTYNSASNLVKSLPTIDAAIPTEAVCHKIAVDGGSTDETQTCLRDHGWTVLEAPRKGIPYQANYALSQVDTEYFAAFEHDIILNPEWFKRTLRAIISDSHIGAIQGLRLYSGSKTMKAIEEWLYRSKRIRVYAWSVDNTLFRTDVVTRAGGFSDDCMASTDAVLRKNMFELGYRWITDTSMISGHYRKNFFEEFRHQMKLFELANFYWSSNANKPTVPQRLLALVGGNPVPPLKMAAQSRMLRVPIAWYILRLQRGLWLSLPHETKSVRPVPMDDWYLAKFKAAVLDSKRIKKQTRRLGHQFAQASLSRCVWCGNPSDLVYMIPSDWGNLAPKLSRGFRGKFAACSDIHAENVAEKIFKSAFDYVDSTSARTNQDQEQFATPQLET